MKRPPPTPTRPVTLVPHTPLVRSYCPVNAGREYASVDISERTLREVHLPAFVAAVEAGVATIMPAFTDLNGVPMTAHKALLQDYMRGELGFDGVLVSDYNARSEEHTSELQSLMRISYAVFCLKKKKYKI